MKIFQIIYTKTKETTAHIRRALIGIVVFLIYLLFGGLFIYASTYGRSLFKLESQIQYEPISNTSTTYHIPIRRGIVLTSVKSLNEVRNVSKHTKYSWDQFIQYYLDDKMILYTREGNTMIFFDKENVSFVILRPEATFKDITFYSLPDSLRPTFT